MRPQLVFLVVVAAVFLNGFVDCGDTSDSETTTKLPSKYGSRQVFTEAPAIANVTESSDNTDNTTVPSTTPKIRKFTYGKFLGRKKTTTTTTTTPTTTTIEPSVSNTTQKAILETSTTEKTILETTTTTEQPSTTSIPDQSTVSPAALTCGVRDPDSDIHPWIVVLEHTDGFNTSRRKTFSKGVLINEQYVLTTVSSIHNSHPFWEVSRVRLGDFPVGLYQKMASYQPVFADIEETIFHPKRDIALIKLASPVNFTEIIQPICLPTSDNYNFRELILHSCHRIKNRKPARVAVESMSVLPISPQDCSTLFHRKGANYNSREEFCSWDERVDNCTGDLGAPLIGLQSGHYHVIGLASYATTNRPIRDSTLPGIYTRVGKHTKWIEKVVKENL